MAKASSSTDSKTQKPVKVDKAPKEVKPQKAEKAQKEVKKEKKEKKDKSPVPEVAQVEPVAPVEETLKSPKVAKTPKSKRVEPVVAEDTTILEETIQEDATETGASGTAGGSITVSVPVKKRKERSFTIEEARKDSRDGEVISLEGKRSRFLANNPAGSARKASSSLFREIAGKDDDNVKIFVAIRETTKDSKKEVYRYTAVRTLAKEKREVKFAGMPEGKQGGNGINFRYNVDLKSAREVKRKVQPVEAAARVSV